jgi:hypothetical protein
MLWTTHAGSEVPLTCAQRSELQDSLLFAHGAIPVRTYSAADTASALNTYSLWESCTSRVAGLFSTMPFKQENADESVVDVPQGLVEDFDPAAAYDPARTHSMEILVDGLLQRAREVAPHFWTHAHRYVPSDSVWCEGGCDETEPEQPLCGSARLQTTRQPVKTVRSPASLKEHKLQQEQMLAPDADQMLYPADVLVSCACGWWRTEASCYVCPWLCGQRASGAQALARRRSCGRDCATVGRMHCRSCRLCSRCWGRCRTCQTTQWQTQTAVRGGRPSLGGCSRWQSRKHGTRESDGAGPLTHRTWQRPGRPACGWGCWRRHGYRV